MHDQTASVVSLAKTILFGLDRTQPTVTVTTATFELLLKSFIDHFERDNPTANKIAAASGAFVASRISGLER